MFIQLVIYSTKIKKDAVNADYYFNMNCVFTTNWKTE